MFLQGQFIARHLKQWSMCLQGQFIAKSRLFYLIQGSEKVNWEISQREKLKTVVPVFVGLVYCEIIYITSIQECHTRSQRSRLLRFVGKTFSWTIYLTNQPSPLSHSDLLYHITLLKFFTITSKFVIPQNYTLVIGRFYCQLQINN